MPCDLVMPTVTFIIRGITNPSCSILKGDLLQITNILDFFVISVIIMSMNKDEQLIYADHVGRFYARRYGFPPMAGRLLGYLTVCVPEKQSIIELADALMASRSAVTGAIQTLENYHLVKRTRVAGERSDSISIDPDGIEGKGFDATIYKEQASLFREGLNVLRDEVSDRRTSILEEAAALAEFLTEQMPVLQKEWHKQRDTLRHDRRKGTSKDRVQKENDNYEK
jgi:DNA-binding transcriptional regulator GbsR (MarR family)